MQQSVKIEFPCDYPIKVVGDAIEGFKELVVEIVQRHDPGLDAAQVSVRDSRNGRFCSIRMTITAIGEEQLKAMFLELKEHDSIHMVL